MEDGLQTYGILKRNKKLETFLLVLGLGLFVLLTMRGLENIGDKDVAAGEAFKTAIVDTNAPQQTNTALATLAHSVDLEAEPKASKPEATNEDKTPNRSDESSNSTTKQEKQSRIAPETPRKKDSKPQIN